MSLDPLHKIYNYCNGCGKTSEASKLVWGPWKCPHCGKEHKQ